MVLAYNRLRRKQISRMDNQMSNLKLPSSWELLETELQADYFNDLVQFVAAERETSVVYPEAADVFSAFEATPLEDVRVLLLGQDPYHGEGQAHGLSFSVREGTKIPPSLRNIYKELADDIGCEIPTHGNLSAWAQQGVLLLNTVLTVRANEANSHRKKGWETFTDAVIRSVSDQPNSAVFMLWGGPAQKKKKLIDTSRHTVIESAHPSPLSAHRGFLGSKPFSKANEALSQSGRGTIDWSL